MDNFHGHSSMAGRSVFNTSKIKMIMKSSPEAGSVSQEAAFLIAKATEVFLTAFAQEALNKSGGSHIDYDNVCDVVEDEESYEFLKSIIPRPLPYPEAEAIYYAKGESDARVKTHFGVDPVRDPDPNQRYPGIDLLFSDSDSPGEDGAGGDCDGIEEVTFSEENRRRWADMRNPHPAEPAVMASPTKPRVKKPKHKVLSAPHHYPPNSGKHPPHGSPQPKHAPRGSPQSKLKPASPKVSAQQPHPRPLVQTSPKLAAAATTVAQPQPMSPASLQPKSVQPKRPSPSSPQAGSLAPRPRPGPQLKPQLQSLLLGEADHAAEKSVDVVTVD